MMRLMFAAALVAALGAFAAISGQTVSGSIANGSVARGGSARATVILAIPGGLHVNSNRPASEYAIPTTVRATGRGVRIGRVNYPSGKNKRFSFSEDRINVYDGRVRFTFDVNVPANYRGRTVSVNVVVRYQACTDEVCYPPTSKNVTLTAQVR